MVILELLVLISLCVRGPTEEGRAVHHVPTTFHVKERMPKEDIESRLVQDRDLARMNAGPPP